MTRKTTETATIITRKNILLKIVSSLSRLIASNRDLDSSLNELKSLFSIRKSSRDQNLKKSSRVEIKS